MHIQQQDMIGVAGEMGIWEESSEQEKAQVDTSERNR
jgi:hypothetical protein